MATAVNSEAEIGPTSLVSKVVVDAAVAGHVFKPGDEPHPTCYYLNLDSMGWIEIGGDSAGWGLAWRRCAVPEDTDMQEYGKVVIRSVRDSLPFASLVGNAVQTMESIVSTARSLPPRADATGFDQMPATSTTSRLGES